MLIPFGTGSYRSRSLPLSAQRMVNSYLEIAPPDAKTAAAVVQAYGVDDLGTVGDGPVRGGIVVNEVAFYVSGQRLFQRTASGVITDLGAIPGYLPVFMAGDGRNVMVTCNGPSYIYDGTAVNRITDPDFPGAQWVAFLDGYMVIGPGDGTVWVNETPFVPTGWNALDFATAEGSPDNIVTGIVDHREVFLFGIDSFEVWYDSGDTDFPLSRTSSGFGEIGCASKYGPAKIDNSVFFPASDGTVRRMNGYTPVRISTHAVEQAIEGYTDKEGHGRCWSEAGHSFYGLFYREGTWVYDCSTQLWHERQSEGQAGSSLSTILRQGQEWIVTDAVNRLGRLNEGTFTEWGNTVVSSVTAPAINRENDLIRHESLELVFEQGVGTIAGQGVDPQVMLDWSDDGGRTWSNEVWRSLGTRGDFRRVAQWNRLGESQDRVYRYKISDPVRRTLIQAVLHAT